MLLFQMAAGSIPGTDHTKPGQPLNLNNHDAFVCRSNNGSIIGIVCDGCGSSKHSEVGAKIGARLLMQAFDKYKNRLDDAAVWRRIEFDLISQISTLTNAMSDPLGSDSYSSIIKEYFLFTIVGFVMTPNRTHLFHIGDGTIFVNGNDIGPPHEFAPPYISYQLTGSSLHDDASDLLHFKITPISTPEINTLLVGTDGVADLVEHCEDHLPNKAEKVGPLSQFWTEDKFFRNNDAVRRRLALINKEIVRDGTIFYGPLRDDTTLISLRRNPMASIEEAAE